MAVADARRRGLSAWPRPIPVGQQGRTDRDLTPPQCLTQVNRA